MIVKYYTENREKEYLIPEGIVMKLGGVREEQYLLTNRDKQNMMGKDRICVVEGKGTLILISGRNITGACVSCWGAAR